MTMKLKSTFIEIAWRLLLLLFLFTALDKIFNFADFKEKINNQIFDLEYTPYLIYAIPGIELLICGLLLWSGTRFMGLISSAALMFCFTFYVALVTFHYFDRVPCSCSGIHEMLSWPQHLVVNIFFLLLSIVGAYFYKSTAASSSSYNYNTA